MATLSFAAQVADWCRRVEGAEEAVFKESAQELAQLVDAILVQLVYSQPISPSGYRRTGFLRSSLMASTSQMPTINPAANPAEGASYAYNGEEIAAVIAGAELGDTINMGYVAAYSAMVHYGANGRAPRPWVTLAADRWPMIVDAKAAELKSRLGL
jgi:hypothetical protein